MANLTDFAKPKLPTNKLAFKKTSPGLKKRPMKLKIASAIKKPMGVSEKLRP